MQLRNSVLEIEHGIDDRPVMESIDRSTGNEEVDHMMNHVMEEARLVLGNVLETEMEVALKNDWLRIVYKKPPWTLQDVLECVNK